MSSPTRNGVDSSPSRQLLSEARRHGQPFARRESMDSPSKQLLYEFSRMLIDSEREFHTRLNEAAAEREKAHNEALEFAATEHERIRQSAERARERHQLELEKELRRREAEEKRKLEEARQAKAESEIAERKRQMEELRRAQAERRMIAEQQKALAEEEAQVKAQQEEEEAEETRRKAEQAESDRRTKEAADAAKKAIPLPPSTSAPASQPSAHLNLSSTLPITPLSSIADTKGLVSSLAQREANHQQYLQIHQRLKEMRKFMLAQGKQSATLKSKMGDMRRKITMSIGQLTTEKGKNQTPTAKIRELLREAVQFSGPRVDVRQFIVSSPSAAQDTEAEVSGLLVYLLNSFAKAIIKQFINEASVSTKAADPIGVLAVAIFAHKDFKWQNRSLVDILLAKYHRVCPVLWGVYGDEKTQNGRQRLGWGRTEPGGPWVNEQTHSERMTGLGAGFAAISLRDFSKSQSQNPVPNIHYWRALACIVNTPPQEATQTHFLVLKAMVQDYAARFLGFYGQAGLAALRKALVEFPAQASKNVAASGCQVLLEVLRRDLKLTL